MTDESTRVTFADSDFETIEAAVLETARGRWFLREFAKRNRNADTEAVLEVLRRIEHAVAENEAEKALDRVRSTLQDVTEVLQDTRRALGLPAREGDDLGRLVESVSLAAGQDSEEALQAIAEERVRRLLLALRYMEVQVDGMRAACRDSAEGPTAPGAARVGEQAVHPGARPSFLM